MDDRDVTPGERFRAWVMERGVEGFSVEAADATHLRVVGEAAVGEVNFYPTLDETAEIAELRISRVPGGEQVFFLHFMMDDLTRAKELFREMEEVLAEQGERRIAHVLLCCTCGITTTMFATKMNEVAAGLGLPYDFSATPVDAMGAAGAGCAAVMLAPQVAHLRAEVATACPNAAVFEIPGRIFGSYDALAAVRLAANVLEQRQATEGLGDVRALRVDEDGWRGRYLVVSAVLGARQSSIEYRVYVDGEVELEGHTTKRRFDFRDVEDLLAGVGLQGVDVGSLDAIGIAVPGIVKAGSVSLPTQDVHDYDLGDRIGRAFGVPVFLDNDANAAAVGCYVSQHSHESVTFHRESFGHASCGQGSIVGGRLVTGRANFAGELNHLVPALAWSADPADLAWTEDGMYELVSRFVLANVCVSAPEVVYVDAWPVTDMARLRAELVTFLGEEYVPELLPAPDFNECILLGELALCRQRMRANARRGRLRLS